MRQLTLTGGPRARGRQHGAAFASEIRTIAGTLWEHLRQRAGVGEIHAIMDRMVLSTRQRLPEVLDEIDGIAAGAGLSFRDALLVSTQSSIQAVLRSRSAACEGVRRDHAGPAANPSTGCSAVAFVDTPLGPVVGKNTDVSPHRADTYVLRTVRPDGGLSWIGYGDVGCIWVEAGLNAAGLALGQATSQLEPGQDGEGVPHLTYLPALLTHCADVSAAIAWLAPLRSAGGGQNLLLADARGTVRAVERAWSGQAVRVPVDGVLYFTNHFLTPELRATVLPSGRAANSEGRLRRYAALCAPGVVPRSLAGIRTLVSDHGAPQAICQHGDSGMHSVLSCLMVPCTRAFHVTDTYPCQERFATHVVPGAAAGHRALPDPEPSPVGGGLDG